MTRSETTNFETTGDGKIKAEGVGELGILYEDSARLILTIKSFRPVLPAQVSTWTCRGHRLTINISHQRKSREDQDKTKVAKHSPSNSSPGWILQLSLLIQTCANSQVGLGEKAYRSTNTLDSTRTQRKSSGPQRSAKITTQAS